MAQEHQQRKGNPLSVLLGDNPADQRWLSEGGSAMALAARRVFITTTNPYASPYDETPQELQAKYGSAWTFFKGVILGHSPLESPPRKILFGFKRILFGLGNLLSFILKIPEWLFYSIQLSLQKNKHPYWAMLFKIPRFLFSFLFSPLNNCIRLKGADKGFGWRIVFMFLPAMLITAALMLTGIGPMLLAAMGVGLIFGSMSFGGVSISIAFLEPLVLSLTFAAATYTGFLIALQNIPNNGFQSTQEKRLAEIMHDIKISLHGDLDPAIKNNISAEVVKFISMLEGRYHFKFTIDQIKNITALLASKLFSEKNSQVIISTFKEEFSIAASKKTEAGYAHTFTAQTRAWFMQEIRESLREIKRLTPQVTDLVKKNKAETTPLNTLPLACKHPIIPELLRQEERLAAARKGLVKHFEGEIERAKAALGTPENRKARLERYVPTSGKWTLEIVEKMLAEEPPLFTSEKKEKIQRLLNVVGIPINMHKIVQIIQQEIDGTPTTSPSSALPLITTAPGQPMPPSSAISITPTPREQKDGISELDVLQIIAQEPSASKTQGSMFRYGPKFFDQPQAKPTEGNGSATHDAKATRSTTPTGRVTPP